MKAKQANAGMKRVLFMVLTMTKTKAQGQLEHLLNAGSIDEDDLIYFCKKAVREAERSLANKSSAGQKKHTKSADGFVLDEEDS
jgi:hypothetical protein